MTRRLLRPLARTARIVALPATLLLSSSCIDRLVGSDAPFTARQMYDMIWSDFDRNYSFFQVKGVDWNAAYAAYLPLIDNSQSPHSVENLTTIQKLFAVLHDEHVDLTVSNGAFAVPSSTVIRSVDFDTIHTWFNPNAIFPVRVPNSTMTPSKFMRYGLAAPGVGYIWIPSFGGSGWAGEIDDVLASLGNVSSVIIDVRTNGGGNTDNSRTIAARFIDQQRVFAYTRYRNGPAHDDFTDYQAVDLAPAGHHFAGHVFVLTNRGDASATEYFLLALRVQPGVTFVGGTTVGAMGNPLIRELPNGWEYRLPQWILSDANKRVLEDIGIVPDLSVPLSAADSLALRDPQLDSAIARAKAAGS